MLKIGVTGGIGSGKSLICSIISAMGYPVYNADLQARNIVEIDTHVQTSIKHLFGDDIYVNGKLDRARVAKIVFSDRQYLEKLNGIVHPAVINHFDVWVKMYHSRQLVVKEAAILFESGANKGLDKIIVVTAPLEVRIKRVQIRDGSDIESIRQRIENQLPQEELIRQSDYIIENDGKKLILPQIISVINQILKE